MPAPVRGSRVQAKPQAKASPAPRAHRAGRAKPAGGARPGVSSKVVLIGAAAALVLGAVAALVTGGRGAMLAATVGRGVDARFGEAGFRLAKVHVQGASALATADIVKAAGVYRGQPLLGLDLGELRGRVEQVGWVKEARVVRLLPDTLVIAVKERRQLAVWQHDGRSVVIDEQGTTIPEADPQRFATLPLVVGAGADRHAAEILPLVAQRPQLVERLEALVRVDDRRWDLRLKDGSLVQLPAAREEEALAQLETLDHRSRILTLGFERIDLRNPDVVAVRPRPAAPSVTTASGDPVAAGA